MLTELFMILLQNHLQQLNGNKVKREIGDGLIFPFFLIKRFWLLFLNYIKKGKMSPSPISRFIRPQIHLLSKMVLNTPWSIKLANIFLMIIKAIGPNNNPITPVILNPVYIAIKVKIG